MIGGPELDRRLKARLDALRPFHARDCFTPRCSRTSNVPCDRLLLGKPKTRTFAELLIDCEEDRTLRAVLVAMLPES